MLLEHWLVAYRLLFLLKGKSIMPGSTDGVRQRSAHRTPNTALDRRTGQDTRAFAELLLDFDEKVLLEPQLLAFPTLCQVSEHSICCDDVGNDQRHRMQERRDGPA